MCLISLRGSRSFFFSVVEAIHENPGLLGLWKTMKHILKEFVKPDDNLILICHDDHQFTKDYSYETLTQSIHDAEKLNAYILLGGVIGYAEIQRCDFRPASALSNAD